MTYIVGCGGVVQLGGLVPGYPWEVPLTLRLGSLFYSMKLPLKFKETPCKAIKCDANYKKVFLLRIICITLYQTNYLSFLYNIHFDPPPPYVTPFFPEAFCPSVTLCLTGLLFT